MIFYGFLPPASSAGWRRCCFHRCLSVNRGYPMVYGPRSVPQSPIPGLSRGYPSLVTGSAQSPVLGPAGGVPMSYIEVASQPGQGDTPCPGTRQGRPPPLCTELGRLCGTGGMPLPFMQEDFLVVLSLILIMKRDHLSVLNFTDSNRLQPYMRVFDSGCISVHTSRQQRIPLHFTSRPVIISHLNPG